RLCDSGRKVVLVTGREIEDLLAIFPDVEVFDRVVAENGGVVYRPASREHKTLGEAPPPELISALRARGISPLSVGHCLVVTREPNGAGVTELMEKLIDGDLADLEGRLSRHAILLGTRETSEEVRLNPYGLGVLIAGSSGSGKSTIATGVLERLAERRYQFCIVDPEGDYALLENAIVLGDKQRAPTVAGALDVLEQPNRNVVVNLLGLGLDERPAFFSRLLPGLQDLRPRTGRPPWTV